MLSPTGLNTLSGKKAKKKFKEPEVFLSGLLMLTIETSHCGSKYNQLISSSVKKKFFTFFLLLAVC